MCTNPVTVKFLLCCLLMAAPTAGTNYVFTSHVIDKDGRHVYTVRHGSVIIKAEYNSSQKSSWPDGKKWDATEVLMNYLHMHSWYAKLDLSQIPAIGVVVNECILSKNKDKDGDQIIAVQPTNAPCIDHYGDILHYLPTPNGEGPNAFQYVNFDILSERIQ
jgi:hypothetical protein